MTPTAAADDDVWCMMCVTCIYTGPIEKPKDAYIICSGLGGRGDIPKWLLELDDGVVRKLSFLYIIYHNHQQQISPSDVSSLSLSLSLSPPFLPLPAYSDFLYLQNPLAVVIGCRKTMTMDVHLNQPFQSKYATSLELNALLNDFRCLPLFGMAK